MMNEALYGVDLFGDPVVPPTRGPIADRFLVPPFSVLNAGEGFWQERKRSWVSLGIKSEVGRDSNALGLSESAEANRQSHAEYGARAATAVSQRLAPGGGGGGCWLGGPKTATSDAFGNTKATENDSGTSIFDPVLCELVYRWFTPAGGLVLDPFAGGSVRGIVAHKLGLRYYGVELREEQVAANREQGAAICPGDEPVWVTGDSMAVLDGADVPRADLLFSCPPYGDLERYSEDPADLSTMEWHTFTAAYRRIILRAARHLRDDRFACFVVGDFRDKRTGFYRNFVGDTVAAFREVGLELYNQAILVTPRGSLPIRIAKQFTAGRKLGKTHQDVLVFVKGDPMRAARACAEIESVA